MSSINEMNLGVVELNNIEAADVSGGFGLLVLGIIGGAALGVLVTAAFEIGKGDAQRYLDSQK